MRSYVRAEIERFLRALDKAVKRRATTILIGGGAVAVKYRVDLPTTDIDTFNGIGHELRRAIDLAREATGLPMPFEQSGVADGPYGFEDRLVRALPSLRRLTLLVPERHDLALMKTVRGDLDDFEKLRALHQKTPFDLSVLLQRYEEEMDHVVIDPLRVLVGTESGEPGGRHSHFLHARSTYEAERSTRGDKSGTNFSARRPATSRNRATLISPAIHAARNDIRVSARRSAFHRVSAFTRSGAEGYTFEPYRAYQSIHRLAG